jgi:hypothetical protein
MSLWNRKKTAEPDRSAENKPVERDSSTLPGIAGYSGTERLPKNAMPGDRFNYVRPDGKP